MDSLTWKELATQGSVCNRRKQIHAINCNMRYGSKFTFSPSLNATAKSFIPEKSRLSVWISGASEGLWYSGQYSTVLFTESLQVLFPITEGGSHHFPGTIKNKHFCTINLMVMRGGSNVKIDMIHTDVISYPYLPLRVVSKILM